MTCKEKWKLDHPKGIFDPTISCPNQYGYLGRPIYCGPVSAGICTPCWDREIPEEIKKEKTMATKKTKAELLSEIAELERQVKDLEKYKEIQDCADDLKAVHTSLVKAGFSDDQAFELLKTTVANVIPNLSRGMRV